MPTTQGWTNPSNAKRFHYILNERSLCRRWGVNRPFVRINLGLGGIAYRRKYLCYDCVRAYQTRTQNFSLPVEPPEEQPRFIG